MTNITNKNGNEKSLKKKREEKIEFLLVSFIVVGVFAFGSKSFMQAYESLNDFGTLFPRKYVKSEFQIHIYIVLYTYVESAET